MIETTIYEKNIKRIAQVAHTAFDRAADTFLPESKDRARVLSFYSGDKLNLYVNWHETFDITELNTITVNIANVDFTNITIDKQQANTTYEISITAKGESSQAVINTILVAARILREKLFAAPNGFFECDEKLVSQLNFDVSQISAGTDNVAAGIITLNITTQEKITDFGDFDFVKNNNTVATADGESYNIYQGWD